MNKKGELNLKLFVEPNPFKYEKELQTVYRNENKITKDKFKLLAKISKERFVLIRKLRASTTQLMLNAPLRTTDTIFQYDYPVFAETITFNSDKAVFELVKPIRIKYPQIILNYHNIECFISFYNKRLHVPPFFSQHV